MHGSRYVNARVQSTMYTCAIVAQHHGNVRKRTESTIYSTVQVESRDRSPRTTDDADGPDNANGPLGIRDGNYLVVPRWTACGIISGSRANCQPVCSLESGLCRVCLPDCFRLSSIVTFAGSTAQLDMLHEARTM